MAVEEMGLSKPERGKTNPLVGAVALLRDGTVLKAPRGLRRISEHAEQTLLERVAERMTDFEGAHLFVTLEPCSPGSRCVREIPCAERVADALFSDVWVGIPDPWPTINGGGIAYLHRRGMSVHPFDGDLQKAIEAENAEWLAAVRDKAAKPRTTTAEDAGLLGRIYDDATVSDLDPKALAYVRRKRKINAAVDSPEFRKALWEEGALDGWRADAHLTGFGIIAFAREPRRFIKWAGLNALIFTPDGREIHKWFDQPAILIPDQVEEWLKGIYPDTEDRNSMVRRSVPQLPFKAIREAVLNGLVHRRYDLEAKCHLVVDDRAQTIVVKSPGEPVDPVTLEDLQHLRASVWGRNKRLVYLFGKLRLVEEQNLGMETFRGLPAAGFPLPAYNLSQGYLVLTIYRTTAAVAVSLAPSSRRLTSAVQRGLEYIATQESVSTAAYAEGVGVSRATAIRHLSHLITEGRIEMAPGTSGPATKYRILRG